MALYVDAMVHLDSKIIDRIKIRAVQNTFSSVQFSSVTELCPTLCDSTNCSTLGLPVHHQLPELTQTHAHRVGDAIQPSHPLSSPPPPAPNPSQHQDLFQWVNSSHELAKVLEVSASASVLPMNTQDWSPSGWTGWISLQSKGLSRVFSNTTVQNTLRRANYGWLWALLFSINTEDCIFQWWL